MTELVRFDLDDGGSVLIEVGDREAGVRRVSRTGEVVKSAAESFGTALAGVRDAAATALRQFRTMDARPDEIQIEFGVRLNAQAGAVIARTGVDGHLKVKLTWQRSRTQREDETDEREKPSPEPTPHQVDQQG